MPCSRWMGLIAAAITLVPCSPAGAAPRPIGGNLNGQFSWTSDFALVDAYTTAGAPHPIGGDGNPDLTKLSQLDAAGWPTADFGVYINEAAPQPGIYSVTGSAARCPRVSLRLTPGAITGVRCDSIGKRFRATVRIDSQGTPGTDGRFVLSFAGTGGGVRDLHVVRPGYDPYRHPVWTDRYVQFLKAHRPTVLRLMDLTATNDSVVAAWSERSLPGRWAMRPLSRSIPVGWSTSNQTVSAHRGLPWEHGLDLCNATGSDCWINVPLLADDTYVRNLAQLAARRLAPKLNLWVEYSNELWNDGFTQTGTNRKLAKADVKAKRGRLDYDRSTDPVALGDRRVAARIVAIGKAFRSAFGRGAARVRPVLAFQYANPDRTREQLAYVSAVHGRPSSLLYAIGVAPYINLGYGPNGDALDVPGLTPDGILSLLGEDADRMAADDLLPEWARMATSNGLSFVAYEGGPDTFGENNIESKTAATLDPRMRSLTEKYLRSWFGRGGGQFNWYTLGADPYGHRFGTWSISDSIDRLDSPKSLGLMTVRNGG